MIEVSKNMVLLFDRMDHDSKGIWHAVVIHHDDNCAAGDNSSACDCQKSEPSLVPASDLKQMMALTRKQRREAELATAKALRKARGAK
jgi:hypothetical protein